MDKKNMFINDYGEYLILSYPIYDIYYTDVFYKTDYGLLIIYEKQASDKEKSEFNHKGAIRWLSNMLDTHFDKVCCKCGRQALEKFVDKWYCSDCYTVWVIERS